jgi:predicted membrane chloride channel (bestrophin family)
VLEFHGLEVNFGNYAQHGVEYDDDWTKKLSILGELTEEEKKGLHNTASTIDAVNIWILGLFTSALNTVLSVPPPVYTRVYQELSNGMQGYQEALRVSQIPLPPVITHMTNGLLICSFIIMPFTVEQTVKSRVLTPLVTFVAAYCYMLIHCISNLLERPYGDDFIDLPMHEMQVSFNRKLEASLPLDINIFSGEEKQLENGHDRHNGPHRSHYGSLIHPSGE